MKHHTKIFLFLQKVDSYGFLTIEKILNLKSIILLIKSVLGKDENYYYYKIIFRKCLYRLGKN